MSGFTKVSRDDVANAAEQFGMAEFQDSRFLGGPLEAEQLGLAWHRIHPDQRSPIAHRHREQEELYVIISGSGRMKLAVEVVPVEAGDVVRVAASTPRGVEAGPDGLEYLAVGAPVVDGAEHDKGELLDGFWD